MREAETQISRLQPRVGLDARFTEAIARQRDLGWRATEPDGEQLTKPAAPHDVAPAISWKAEPFGASTFVGAQHAREPSALGNTRIESHPVQFDDGYRRGGEFALPFRRHAFSGRHSPAPPHHRQPSPVDRATTGFVRTERPGEEPRLHRQGTGPTDEPSFRRNALP